MAGAGYKLFVSGDVLTAAQVNTYLNEQTVMVFATSAARTSALSAVLAEGMMSYLQDSNTVYYYDGAAWNALASGDITAITAGNGISVTSGTGPVPTVAIDTAVTVDKTTAQTLTNKTLTSPALTTPTISTLTTNGDLLYGTGSGALSRLGIGSSAQVLTVASGVPSWATPAGASGPAFSAYSATNQTISSGVYTKITFGSEDYDTAGNFASNRFTPTTSGYYQLNFGGYVDASGATNYGSARLYFNGAAIRACNYTDTTNDYSPVIADIVYFNGSTDYVEIFTYINGGGTVVGNASAPRYTYFSGVWIRS